MKEEKVIKNLGEIKGKLLFFGGVYSNLQALEALKNYAEENNYFQQQVFCTGDIIGYCAQPVECIELIKDWKINVIAGNVELQLRADEEDCGCDFTSGGRCELFSKNWYTYARSKMNNEAKDWLKSLPHFIQFKYHKYAVSIVHGSWYNTAEFIFKSTCWQSKQENFDAAQSNIIIAGHAGLPFADVKDQMHWINAGVIGMPANDGTSRVWFVTLQDNNNNEPLYTFRHLDYDHLKAAALMLANALPPSYARTLSTGIWDNCEILPEAETNVQGIPLAF